MPSIKERIEQNLVVWLLTSLLTGFGAGMGAYRTIQEIGGLTPVPKSRFEDLQKTVETLKTTLSECTASGDSLRSAAAVLRDSLVMVARPAPSGHGQSAQIKSVAKLPGLKNVRIHIIHLPSQASVAAQLADQIEARGAITSTKAIRFDRSYWSIIIKKESDKGLVAAALLKSNFPGLSVLPIRQKLPEEEPGDLVIWLSSDYR
jgi:hypothetical protein